MRKIIASVTIAAAAALGTAPAVAAATAAAIASHGMQAASSSDSPGLFYHA